MRSRLNALGSAALLAPVALLSVTFWGCSDKSGKTEQQPAAVSTSSAKVEASAAALPSGSAAAPRAKKRKAPKTREAPPPEKMQAYRKHLTDGRLNGSKSLWPEAIKSFDAALEVVPGDAAALTELSWALFKAGELERAKKVGNEAISRTTSPKLKAMAHYNMGRVAEEQKENQVAIDHYRKSIELRPNETVEKRLAALTKDAKAQAAAPVAEKSLPCQTPVAKIEDVCACLLKTPTEETAERTCTQKEVKLGRDDLAVLEFTTTMFEADYILVGRTAAGYMPIATLGSTYNPGAFGIYEEVEVEKAEEKTAGATKVLWIEAKKNRHDSDMGLDEFEEESTRIVTLCVPPQGESKAWRCPLTVPVEWTYVRDRMRLEGFAPDEVTRGLMTKNLPLKDAYSLEIALSEGKADVKVKAGKPPTNVKALAGTHKL